MMEGVLNRLEAVTSRLESYERGLQSTTGTATAAGSSTPIPKPTVVKPAAEKKNVIISVDPPKTVTIMDWDSLVSEEVGALSAAGGKLPDEFQSSTKLFARAAQMMVDVVKQSRSCRKPTVQEMSAVVAPLGATMQEIEAIIRGPRRPSTNHHRAVSECVQSFAWVTLDAATGAPPPGAMLSECQAGADMFINKVIMEYRQKAPEHKEWATALKNFMVKLQSLAAGQFPQGLTWLGTSAPGAIPPRSKAPEPATPEPAAEPATAEPAASEPAAAEPETAEAETAEPAAESTDASAATVAQGASAEEDTASGTAAAVAESSAVPENDAEFHDAEAAEVEPTATAPQSYYSATSAPTPPAADSEAEDPAVSLEEAAAASNGVADAAEESQQATPAPAPAAPAGPPPPLPPPPAGMLLEKLSAASGAASGGGAGGDARGELMAALNKGSDVTTGLKRVTDDMKTKNQENRSSIVKAAPADPKRAAAAAKGPPCKELKQNRWIVENWVGSEEPVVLEEADLQRNHAVYISNCAQCVIQVKGKVNTIMLDACSKVGLVFSSVLATVEAVNCKNCQIQCELTCPTLSIDKTDGAKLFLSEEAAAATEVVTSKCSALTVTVLPKDAESDPVEHPVPEQFISKMVEGKLVTTPVVHT